VGLTRRKALATSPGFSMLLDVRRLGDGPGVKLVRWGLCGVPSIWCSPTTRHPGGSPRRYRRVRRLALPPECRVVALRGGRGDATPRLPNPVAAVLRLASRRSARPARARSFRLTRSSGRPSKPPDHGPESSADQRTSFVVSQRCISLLSVFSSAETAHRRPPIWDLECRIGACAEWRWPLAVVAWRTRCVREIPSVNVV
jgi:hypothetical protein